MSYEHAFSMKKIIITGANGAGKSHFAARLAAVRPDVPVISFDAIKLLTDWQQRPRAEVVASLAKALAQPSWILEGGPSLLPHAIGAADALVWLDPPERIRAWQLAKRPWTFFGKTRPELPSGNVDWPWEQYRFALQSYRKRSKVRSYLSDAFEGVEDSCKWRCRSEEDRRNVVRVWAIAAP